MTKKAVSKKNIAKQKKEKSGLKSNTPDLVVVLFDRMATRENPVGNRVVWNKTTNECFMPTEQIDELVRKGKFPIEQPIFPKKTSPASSEKMKWWIKENKIVFHRYPITI